MPLWQNCRCSATLTYNGSFPSTYLSIAVNGSRKLSSARSYFTSDKRNSGLCSRFGSLLWRDRGQIGGLTINLPYALRYSEVKVRLSAFAQESSSECFSFFDPVNSAIVLRYSQRMWVFEACRWACSARCDHSLY